MKEENLESHPWMRFVRARQEVILWMLANGKSLDDIAEELSMAVGHLHDIVKESKQSIRRMKNDSV